MSEINNENKENESQSGNRIDFNDFLQIMEIKLMEKESDEEIAKAFELFVDPKQNEITFESLKDIARQIGESVTDEELISLLREANGDENEDSVDKEMFIRIVKAGYEHMKN